jgi:hypothetical protein
MTLQRCPMGCGQMVERALTWKIDEPRRRGEPQKWMLLDPGQRPDTDGYANIAVYRTATGTLMARVLGTKG